MAEQPILFLSHSTARLPPGDIAVKVKNALVKALKANGWYVFVDSQSVKGGDLWRTEILHSLATSKAGIILLNKDAAESAWVRAEAQILCFRKSINSAFPLLPIVLPGADIDATFLKTYEPFQFNEIQRSMFTFKAGDSVPTFAKSVANNSNLEQGKQSVAIADWVQRVVDIIGGLKPDVLSRVVGKLKLTAVPELLEPTPAGEVCLRVRSALANLLHHESPQVSFDAVKLLIAALSKESALRLRTYLQSKWVENESAELLLLAARAPEQQGLLGLNTSLQLVVNQYKDRLTTEIPLEGPIPRFIDVAQPNGDFDEAGLTKKVEDAITKRFFPIQRTYENGEPMPLEEAVAEVLQPDGFAVAFLWPPYCDKSFLKKLRGRFPRIVFIALSGDKAQAASEYVEAGGRDLVPKLTSQKLNQLSELISSWDSLLELNFP